MVRRLLPQVGQLVGWSFWNLLFMGEYLVAASPSLKRKFLVALSSQPSTTAFQRFSA
jgi:hypothetical protein